MPQRPVCWGPSPSGSSQLGADQAWLALRLLGLGRYNSVRFVSPIARPPPTSTPPESGVLDGVWTDAGRMTVSTLLPASFAQKRIWSCEMLRHRRSSCALGGSSPRPPDRHQRRCRGRPGLVDRAGRPGARDPLPHRDRRGAGRHALPGLRPDGHARPAHRADRSRPGDQGRQGHGTSPTSSGASWGWSGSTGRSTSSTRRSCRRFATPTATARPTSGST